jgi:hypothetical protein
MIECAGRDVLASHERSPCRLKRWTGLNAVGKHPHLVAQRSV